MWPAAWPASAVARQRVAGRCHQHQRVVGKVLAHHVHVLGRLAHDVEVVLVGGQALQQVFAVADLHGHLDARVRHAEAAQQLGHGVFHGGEDGYAQAAALHPVQRVQVLRQALQPLGHVLAGLGQRLTGGGGVDLFAQLFEQGLAHRFGQLLDLQRQRGRRQVQRLGRTGKAAMLGHRPEDAQLVQGDVAQVHG